MGISSFGPRSIHAQVVLIVLLAIALVAVSGRLFDRINALGYVAAADVDVIGQRALTLSLLLRDAEAGDRDRILSLAAAAGIDLRIIPRGEVDTLPAPHDLESRLRQLLGFLFPPDTDLSPGAAMIVFEGRPAFAVPIDGYDTLIYRSVPDTVLTTDFTNPIFYYLLSFLILVGLFSLFTVRAITAPLKSIVGKLRDTEAFLAQSEPLREIGSVEVVQLTRVLNDMRFRIQTMIESRTRMLRGVSHDLRTPLTRVRMRAEHIEDAKVRTPILSDIGQVNALIDATLDFLRHDRSTEAWERADIASIMQTVCSDFLDMDRAITYEGPSRLILFCKPSALSRAITNLCENGLKFGTQVRMVLREDDGAARIEILDDGPGILPQFRDQVLEPFFKMDAARTHGAHHAGFGLGLSIVAEIVRDHGGTLVLADNMPRGLRASIVLPRHEEPPRRDGRSFGAGWTDLR